MEPLLEYPFLHSSNDTDSVAPYAKMWSCAVTASRFDATTSAPISRIRYMVDVLFQVAPPAIWVQITPLPESSAPTHVSLM